MTDSSFKTFVYGSSQLTQAELPIAATRAGGIGVINAELETDFDNILRCLERLAHPVSGAKGPYGLKLGANAKDILDNLDLGQHNNLAWMIFDSAVLNQLAASKKFKKPDGIQVLAECITRDIPDCVKKGFVDGLMIKGNESGGYVGEESSFILLQKWITQTDLPLYVRGGLTPHVAAACHAMGLKGGVLDSQVLLLNDSPLSNTPLRKILATLSGSETVAVGDSEQSYYFRVLNHPQFKAARDFIAKGEGLSPDSLRALVSAQTIDWHDPKAGLLPVGHDIGFAEPWRKQYGSMAAVLRAINDAVESYAVIAAANPPLRTDSPLAETLGIRLPILQGPMTRVSDEPQFARAVAEGGALPMLAFALLTGAQVSDLLEKAKPLLSDKKWGIGLLGFVPPELLAEQIGAALPHKPDYAIIAGGRPDQVVALEAQGISSFLHLPSATLLGNFLKGGARRFIFEGRECGGHIGPLSSFVLWSSMIDRLLTSLDENNIAGEDVQCIFAGGIHDEWSSALLQVMVAPLIERNIKIGIIMGSAYLFTKEIVESGAIVEQFQKVVIACEQTVVLETGPGHASRCALTPFAKTFFKARKDFRAQGDLAADTIRERLDKMILGTLRLASKGMIRKDGKGELTKVSGAEQKQDGMYMLGQVVLLRDKIITIKDLHAQVTEGAARLLEQAASRTGPDKTRGAARPADIAIVGMSCALPGAKDIQTFWENILDKFNAVIEIPAHRWDSRLYFDADRYAPDKIYSKWGGFLEDMPFDPMKYGITPKSIESVDPMQLMALEVAQAALKDANYSYGKKDRERTSVIIGASGGAGDVGAQYGLRAELPRFAGSLPESVADKLPEWTEDTFAGILINVVAGRIANRLDLGGANFTTDAACASSMAAIYQAVLDLSSGNSDTVIAGGVDTVQGPFGYMCFSKTQALSPRGVCNTFDQSSDGIVISEGIAMLVLKRLEDAERDGDRIYAVIKGVGVGSDGKAKGLSAPLPAGQLRAMRRAYAQAGFSPASVRLFEAHGTGTAAGDTAELESTSSLLIESGAQPRQSVVGSVKTMIGHTKASAGAVGLLKATLALHNKILPPHRGVVNPNKALLDHNGPLYIIDEAEPWLTGNDTPRRAAVSAFGFGGTNFHLALEEYCGEYRAWNRPASRNRWPAELFLWSGKDRADLKTAIAITCAMLTRNPDIALRDLACALASTYTQAGETIAIVARDFDELAQQANATITSLDNSASLPSGAYQGTGDIDGKLAVLFPGQGSQYTAMLREVMMQFPACIETLSLADRMLSAPFTTRFGPGASLSRFIYPRGVYSQHDKEDAEKLLRSTDITQPALGAVEAALWSVMTAFGLQADMLAGHSYGEFTALYAAKRIDFTDLMAISEARGRLIVDKAREAGSELGGMAAAKGDRADIEATIKDIRDIIVANHNAPQQVIISGSEQALTLAAERLKLTRLPVAAAFHSPFVEPARASLAKVIGAVEWKDGNGIAVYSNTTAQPHSKDADILKKAMENHMVCPVEFVAEIEAMYKDGARVFLELGPKSVLTGLTGRILGDRPHKAIAFDDKGGGIPGMLHAFAQLLCAGVNLDVMKLFEGRDCLPDISSAHRNPPVPKHAWMLNGSGVRRANDPVRRVGVSADAPATPMNMLSVPDSKPALSTHLTAQPRRVMPAMTRTSLPQSSVADAYFELLDRQLNNARDVALAELGVSPSSASDAIPPRRAAPLPRQSATLPAAQEQRTPALLPAARPVATAPKVNGHANGHANGHSNGHYIAPVAAKPEPVVVPAAAPSGALDQDRLKDIILTVVTEKTGYESDMISFTQSMEADLGIDSIKRVEIVGGVLGALPDIYLKGLGDAGRTQLSTAATLDRMLSLLAEAGGKTVNFNQAGTESTVTDTIIRHPSRQLETRFEVSATEEEIPENVSRKLTIGDFIITPDQSGVAAIIAARLTEKGCTTHIVPPAALKDENALLAWFGTMNLSALAGVIHLAPLGAHGLQTDATPKLWREQIFINEKSLYLLLRHFSLKESAHVLAASALGGTFARSREASDTLKIQGGAVGLIKSFCKEREDVRGKAVDVDPDSDTRIITDQIIDELEIDGGRIEVGYPKGQRTIFKTIAVALPDTLPVTGTGLVVLATGGARGVTAETLRELAMPGNTLILTGRSPLPEAESSETADLKEEKDLVRHFVKTLSLQLSDARKKAKSVLAAREQMQNVADFRSSGATVDYRAVDVANDTAMRDMIADIYKIYGKIDGVVHGAGIIEDKLLADITPESWSRVVETKVFGLLLLQKYIKTDGLKFFTVFSSVAGRYGNSGQTNYATANELMNRLCGQLQARWGGKVAVSALCWGPWGKTKFGAGMVTEATEEKFSRHGVQLVSSELGRALFLNQVAGNNTSVEIICGAGPWEQYEAHKGRFKLGEDSLPLLSDSTLGHSFSGQSASLDITLNQNHAYLLDHVIDEHPVLPMAMALEMMAQAAEKAFGKDWIVTEINGGHLFKGVLVNQADYPLTIQMNADLIHDTERMSVKVRIVSRGDKPVPHYGATIILTKTLPVTGNVSRAEGPSDRLVTVREAYDLWLFHGPRFQVIESIDVFSRAGVQAKVRATAPEDMMTETAGKWFFDPGLIDAAAHTSVLWMSLFHNVFALPVKFDRIVRYATISPQELRMDYIIREQNGESLKVDVWFSDKGDNAVLFIEGMQHIASKTHKVGITKKSLAA